MTSGRHTSWARVWAASALAAAAVAGCASPPDGIESPVPVRRAEAMAAAARAGDESAIKPLIEMLDSDDPAVRLLSIEALEEITGQTLGYDYAAPEWQRLPAVDRWVVWYSKKTGAPVAPAGGLATPER